MTLSQSPSSFQEMMWISNKLKAGGGGTALYDNYTDCYDLSLMNLKIFAVGFKSYMYPGTIEFSITCATIFIITWFRIGVKNNHSYTIPFTEKKIEGVGLVRVPDASHFIMIDCSKTSSGLFVGILIVAASLISSIFFIVYNSNDDTRDVAKLMTEVAEIVLLVVALTITALTYHRIKKFYQKVIPETNMFDIILEVFSLFGVYAFNVNSLIAIFYKLSTMQHDNNNDFYRSNETAGEEENSLYFESEITATIASILSIVQCSLQTLLILECFRRYAYKNYSLLHKPGRELITALLFTNVSLWIFDTLSAKKFDSKEFIIDHFGILKWSIINAFSSPIAVFYRFHSSVCLSDIWYGLFYGEHPEHDDDHEAADAPSYNQSSNNDVQIDDTYIYA
jgi:hypothetical protein